MLNLSEKKQFYVNKLNEIKNEDYSAEINLKLDEYKLKLISEFENQRSTDIEKINTYIELLNELLSDYEKEEIEENKNEGEE